ncbi:uncharacterized protein LOC143296590 [Babylonia areolata]|uniref:uncharacterized protein LOC143296590 n=1 Tax=Babylonia areolata TaxID=304850 RepID=UPI003FD29777
MKDLYIVSRAPLVMGRSGEKSQVRALSLILCGLLVRVTGDTSTFWDSHIGVCDRSWEKVYAHDHTGGALFGHRRSLTAVVTAGDVIRIVIDSIPEFEDPTKKTTTTTYAFEADNAVISRGQVCVEALSLHNHFNHLFHDHNHGDTLWHVLLCSATGNLHVLGVRIGAASERLISDRHVGASATWYVKSWAVRQRGHCYQGVSAAPADGGVGGGGGAGGGSSSSTTTTTTFCEKRPSSEFWPVYGHFATGVAVGRRRVSILLEAVKRGQDVRGSMRDRGYSFPMHAVHWSEMKEEGKEEGGWVGGYGLWHVGQRLFPKDVGLREDRPYLWLSSWSTTGRRHNSRWALQGHVSQGANEDTVALDWMTDACWRHVYSHDESGHPVRGSLEELRASVRAGHRVRVVLGHVASEADVIRMRGGHVAAQLLSLMTSVASSSRERHHLLHDSPRSSWKVVHTTGTVWHHEVMLTNYTLLSQAPSTSPVSWFVDSRPWTSLLRLTNQNVLSGHATHVADAVRAGASVRVRIRHTLENGETFASASSLKIMSTMLPTGKEEVTSAQILRFLGDQVVGESEVRLQGQLIWWMMVVDTEGVMSLSAWNTAQKLKYFDISSTPEIDWFANT